MARIFSSETRYFTVALLRPDETRVAYGFPTCRGTPVRGGWVPFRAARPALASTGPDRGPRHLGGRRGARYQLGDKDCLNRAERLRPLLRSRRRGRDERDRRRDHEFADPRQADRRPADAPPCGARHDGRGRRRRRGLSSGRADDGGAEKPARSLRVSAVRLRRRVPTASIRTRPRTRGARRTQTRSGSASDLEHEFRRLLG